LTILAGLLQAVLLIGGTYGLGPLGLGPD